MKPKSHQPETDTDEDQAKRRAEAIKRSRVMSRNNKAQYLRVYLCPSCRQYHLTHERKY